MMYIYFASGLLAGFSFTAFILIKELYTLNKRNHVQANRIARLEQLNQLLSSQISEAVSYTHLRAHETG
jgi:Na+/H+ antiporter NhaA